MQKSTMNRVRKVQHGEGGMTVLQAAVLIAVFIILAYATYRYFEATYSLEKTEIELRSRTGWERYEGYEDESESVTEEGP